MADLGGSATIPWLMETAIQATFEYTLLTEGTRRQYIQDISQPKYYCQSRYQIPQLALVYSKQINTKLDQSPVALKARFGHPRPPPIEPHAGPRAVTCPIILLYLSATF